MRLNQNHPPIFLSARLALAALLCALIAAPAAFAGTDFTQGTLNIKDLMASATLLTPETCPNADEVLVDDNILEEYNPDGTGQVWDDTLLKVLTEKGRRNNQTLSFHFSLQYSTTSVTLLQIIKPDGKIIPVDVPGMSKVMIDPGMMDSNIYDPNDKVLQVGVPGLEIGDMVRYTSYNRVFKARVPRTWSGYQVFEYTTPIRHVTYEISAPAELPLKTIALKAPVGETVRHTRAETPDKRIHYRWEVRDVPRMFPEPNMPAMDTVTQRLLASTIPDWRELSKWYWNLSLPHLKATPAMRAKVSELTAGLASDDARMRAIFKFVSQQIRYMGITTETEAPGYEPHDAAMTFDNRFGVCRDKAALLVTMLREAGLKAWPVLIMVGPKKDPEVPQPYFNHAIVAVESRPGEYQLMDATNENTKEIFPAYLCNRSYLVAKPDGETLLTSPIVPAEQNLLKIDSKARIDAAGNLSCDTSLRFEGINDTLYRGRLSHSKPEERKRFFEGMVKRVAPGASLKSLDITPADPQDTSRMLEVKLSFEAKDALARGKDVAMLAPPYFGSAVGVVNFIIGQTGLDKRKYTMETEYACGTRENLRLEIDPAAGKMDPLPDYPVVTDKSVLWKRGQKMEGNTLVSSTDFLFNVVEVEPTQYLSLKERLKELEFNGRKRILFRDGGGTGMADARVLLRETNYEVKDGRNWTVEETKRYQVLTYKGKKENAELRFQYNPAWETVELKSAVVTTGATSKTIGKQEINLMDAPWVSSAPRYPEEKILVASLPGVEVGSVVEYHVRREFKNRAFFALRHSFQSNDPVVECRLRLTAPKDLPVKFFKTGGLENKDLANFTETIKKDGAVVTREWTGRNLAAVRPEEALPPGWSFTPTLSASTGDWQQYARKVGAALRQAADTRHDAAKIARETTAACKTTPAKVRAIRDFIAINIRAAGPGLSDMPLSAVTSADKTLSDGYGNSADRAVLTAAMLRAAGIDANFVLASNSPLDSAPARENLARLAEDCPMVSTFPEVLLGLTLNGKPLYLNDTDQYDALGVTAHHGNVALELTGANWLERAFGAKAGGLGLITAEPEMRNQSMVEKRIRLDANGGAEIRVENKYFGNAYGDTRKFFTELPAEERRRHFLEMAAEISQTAKIISEPVTDFDHYPGVVSLTVKVDKFAVPDGNRLYFQLPSTLDNLLGLRSDTRDNPLYWGAPTRKTIKTEILLPGEYRKVAIEPKEIDWRAPNNAGIITVRHIAAKEKDASKLIFTAETNLLPAVIPADRYSELLEINRKLSHPSQRAILLERTAP